jgi:hypothetical protein
MLAESKNAKLYAEFLDCVKVPETRDAFRYLVGLAATLKSYSCHPHQSDPANKRDFQFWNLEGDQQPFSFLTNQKWLLFYFRNLAGQSNHCTYESLKETFGDEANENPAGEWTVKLQSIPDVQRLWKLLSID